MISAPARPQTPQSDIQREMRRRGMKLAAQTDLTAYSTYVDPKMEAEYQAPHQLLLDQYLMRVEAGEIKRLMIFMPPRHWKTSKVSQKFAQWFIGKRFTERGEKYSVMVASYGAELAESISQPSRDVVRDEPLYREVFPEVKMAHSSQSAGEWGLRRKDGLGDMTYPAMVATGVGGAALGKGADLFIIDDPVKGMANAQSPAVQKSQMQWFTNTARKRLNPDAAMVFVMQRFSQLDLAGQLLSLMAEDKGEKWEVLVLPALAYTDEERRSARQQGIPVPDRDPLGRLPGEPLWAEKYDMTWHNDSRSIDPDGFAATDQQMPQKPGGYLIGRDDFKMLDIMPEKDVEWVLAVDVALTEKELANKNRNQPDYTVCGLVGLWTPDGDQNDARLILGDMRFLQTRDPDLFVKRAILDWEKDYKMRFPIRFAQDNVDKMAENNLQRDAELVSFDIQVLPNIKGDKVVRSNPWRNKAKRGRFYVVRAPWNNFFFSTVESFPRGWPDDPVDMVSVGTYALGAGDSDGADVIPDIWDM